MDGRTTHSDVHRHYLPGLGLHALQPLYDVVHRLFGIAGLHREMVRRAELRPGQRVLDVGCGTGNLLVALGRWRPDLELAGLDPDPTALRAAERKARRAGVAVAWERGFAEHLPYPDGSVDRVFSSLMLHHLDPAAKDGLLAEVRRVLRPDGLLVLADFDGEAHAHGPFGRRMARSQRLRDNADLSGRVAAAGLTPEPAVPYSLRVGHVEIIRAARGS
jgi:ubiquinone/menaquinone biosynthesis C-methylase UbiE